MMLNSQMKAIPKPQRSLAAVGHVHAADDREEEGDAPGVGAVVDAAEAGESRAGARRSMGARLEPSGGTARSAGLERRAAEEAIGSERVGRRSWVLGTWCSSDRPALRRPAWWSSNEGLVGRLASVAVADDAPARSARSRATRSCRRAAGLRAPPRRRRWRPRRVGRLPRARGSPPGRPRSSPRRRVAAPAW